MPDRLIQARELGDKRLDFYLALRRKRDYDDYLTFSCEHLLNLLNIKPNATNKGGAFYKLKDFLIWMDKNGYIEHLDYGNLKLKELAFAKFYEAEWYSPSGGHVKLEDKFGELDLRGDELLLYCSLKWKSGGKQSVPKLYKGSMAGLTGLSKPAVEKALKGLADKKYLAYRSEKHEGTFIKLLKIKEGKESEHTN